MDTKPEDLDEARRLVAANELVAEASSHLTVEIAVNLPFDALVSFKNHLKRFFSAAPWSDDDAARLSSLVLKHAPPSGWWEHSLGHGLTMAHGFRDGAYHLWVAGGEGPATSVFDRVFDGPVQPEATPHPRKVKFHTGGDPAPGIWYRRGDDIDDGRVAALLSDDDVSDVMVAGDFVTVGLVKSASWEERLDGLLETVTNQFYVAGNIPAPPTLTRDEMVGEGLRTATPEQLHLLDPDKPSHRQRLTEALGDPTAEVRRVALATLAQSSDDAYVAAVLGAAFGDSHRIVRRMAIDAAADLATENLRPLFELALGDSDSWVRWKAIRGLREIGVARSAASVAGLADDEDFQVRLEVATALKDHD